LRHELHWEAPPELTACLLGLIPGATGFVVSPPPRPKSWYSLLVLALTAVAIGLSLAVAWQLYNTVGIEFGFAASLEQLRNAPLLGLQRLDEALPASRPAVAVLIALRDQLHWLLLALVLWLALDGWQPQFKRTVTSG
ncbi:MAG: anti-sigma factor, partial [Chloroflexales bacterium]